MIRDADKKGVVDIAKEMGDLAKLARDGKLKPDQMQGGTFTISSLGGIGGTYFTPIINAPEVAIMGVCRSFWKQVSTDGKTSSWRYILPLSLSWDHRVIDGASAARFNAHFGGTARRHAPHRHLTRDATMATIEVKVPDIGDFKDVPVIEVLVKPGDTVAKEASLVTLESDKATMDVPSPVDGIGEGTEGQGRRQGERRLAHPHGGVRGRGGARRRSLPPAAPLPRRRSLEPAPAPAEPAAPAPGGGQLYAARPTSNARCSCWAPVPAAIPRRSAAPTSA